METNKNIPHYLAGVGLFILLKFGFTVADNNALAFLLKPTNRLVELLTSSQSLYLPDNGYYHESLNIIIDKSCSGFNFWVLCFLLFTYLLVKHFDQPFSKTLAIPAALMSAYLLTIFVNTSRIFVSIIVQKLTSNISPDQQRILHEAIGIITNLTFLILAYIFIEKLLNSRKIQIKNRSNEKPA